jgi:cytoskeletal protein RodZ
MTPNPAPGPRGPTPSGLRQARIARVHMIRRRVIASSVALFATVWMLITLMLVTGHDPALARQRTASVRSATATATNTNTATTPSTTTPTTASTATSPSTSSSTASSGSGSGVSAVTSSQS